MYVIEYVVYDIVFSHVSNADVSGVTGSSGMARDVGNVAVDVVYRQSAEIAILISANPRTGYPYICPDLYAVWDNR